MFSKFIAARTAAKGGGDTKLTRTHTLPAKEMPVRPGAQPFIPGAKNYGVTGPDLSTAAPFAAVPRLFP